MSDLRQSPFWLVWRYGSDPPTYRHLSQKAATTEAQRLALQSPGMQFFVMEAKAGYTVPEPPVQTITIEEDDMPF